jgi:hypothetical protein
MIRTKKEPLKSDSVEKNDNHLEIRREYPTKTLHSILLTALY